MKKKYLRLIITTALGAILGVFCILGVRTRMPTSPEPSAAIYLLGAWYNRLIMGAVIGLAGEIHIFSDKYRIFESIIRGLIILEAAAFV